MEPQTQQSIPPPEESENKFFKMPNNKFVFAFISSVGFILIASTLMWKYYPGGGWVYPALLITLFGAIISLLILHGKKNKTFRNESSSFLKYILFFLLYFIVTYVVFFATMPI